MKRKYEEEELPLLKAAPLKKQEALFQVKYLVSKDALKEAAAIALAYGLDKAYLESLLTAQDCEKLSQTLEKHCS